MATPSVSVDEDEYPNDQGSNQGSNFQSQHTTDDNIDIAVIPPPPKIAKFEKTPDLKSKKPPIISCPRCQKCFTRKNSLNEHRKSCLRKLFFRFQYFRWRRGQMKTCFIWGYKICFGSGRVPNFAKYAKMIVLGQIYIHQLAEFRCWCLKCFIRKGSYSWQVRHISVFWHSWISAICSGEPQPLNHRFRRFGTKAHLFWHSCISSICSGEPQRELYDGAYNTAGGPAKQHEASCPACSMVA